MSSREVRPNARVIVHAFEESPTDAISKGMELVTEAPIDPHSLGPEEVLLEIRSATVGWVDLLMTSGQYQHMPKPPYTPGLEYAGVVVACGPNVGSHVTVGMRALIDGSVAGPRSLGNYQHAGGFARYAVVPSQAVLPVPKGLTLDQAANLLGNYETAYHCLVTRGNLQAGETVLIHGASGSTGLAAVHIARFRNCPTDWLLDRA